MSLHVHGGHIYGGHNTYIRPILSFLWRGILQCSRVSQYAGNKPDAHARVTKFHLPTLQLDNHARAILIKRTDHRFYRREIIAPFAQRSRSTRSIAFFYRRSVDSGIKDGYRIKIFRVTHAQDSIPFVLLHERDIFDQRYINVTRDYNYLINRSVHDSC